MLELEACDIVVVPEERESRDGQPRDGARA
jgi:hypothetical protein